MADKYNFTIPQGSTFDPQVFWNSSNLVVKPIAGISNSIRPTIQVAGHGIPLGIEWPAYIRGVKGMVGINNKPEDIGDPEKFKMLMAKDLDSLILYEDTTDYPLFTSGGELAYYPPIDISTGYTARMQIKKKVTDATPLFEITSDPVSGSRIIIDGVRGMLTLYMEATDTAGFTFKEGVYDLEIATTDTPSVVNRILTGNVKVSPEVTK